MSARRGLAILGMAAAITLALSGCSDTDEPRIQTLGELGAAYLDAGGQCDDLVEQYRADDSTPPIATCGDSTILAIAADTATADSLRLEYRMLGLLALEGDGWFIVDPDVQQLASPLGGEVIEPPSAAGPSNAASNAFVLLPGGALAESPAESDASSPAPIADVPGAATIELYLDVECPSCASFVEANAASIKAWVAEGSAQLVLHPVALADDPQTDYFATRANNAIACVAEAGPQSVVDFALALYAEPDAAETGDEAFIALAESFGVDIANCARQITYLGWVRDVTEMTAASTLADGYDFRGTPTILVNDLQFVGDPANAAEFEEFFASQLTIP
ncbi:DsbA family protein [Humidisolicoccus flavus]|uniref:DsbA family protein n=1 Tax=Humidisolicoccus flavus TaxID=3111414 RepID=UPI0032464548